MDLVRANSKITLLLCIVPVVSGCAALGVADVVDYWYAKEFRDSLVDLSKLDAETQTGLTKITFVESADGLNAMFKGEVTGSACRQTTRWQPELNEMNGTTPEQAATRQLQFKAMQRAANAVAARSCKHTEGIDWRHNCFGSWTCTGEAILIP